MLLLSTLVTLSVGLFYLSIASNRLTNANFGGDGGDFLAAIITRGIPHPTGYPTYILLGILFQYFPFDTPVFRGVLTSLIPAAVGAGLLTGWMCYIIGKKSLSSFVAAAVTGTAWGVAPLLFSQAVIVEVLGLQSLIVVLVIWWLTLNLDHVPGHNVNWLLGISFLVGLGVGNHLTIVLFAPAAALVLIYFIIHSGSWKLALAQITLIFAGMLIYIYLPLRAQAYPAINWGNPQTWSGFLWEVTADPYHGLLFSAKTPALWERVRSISSLLLDQFGALSLIAGAIGVIQYSFRIKWLRWILLWIFVAYLAFAIGYNTKDSVGYLLPAIMVFAIWIGLSVLSIWNINWRQISIGQLLIIILIISIWLRIPGTRNRLDTRMQDQPALYAEQLLKAAPTNAIVTTTTDQDTFPLWYYHFGLKERPDLRVIVLPLTQFVWYQETLVHTYPDLNYPAIYEKDIPNADWGKEVARMNPERAVCKTQVSAEAETGVSFQCSSP